ncbi:hypothetical protein [Aneurinibacillus terranovensis]|uniref:hypothetical protein n=1 Tax=Aneurinibacillus terranovensis TaxID=278991 RepID=UPI003CCC07A1
MVHEPLPPQRCETTTRPFEAARSTVSPRRTSTRFSCGLKVMIGMKNTTPVAY